MQFFIIKSPISTSDRQTLLQKLEKIETAIRTTRNSQNSRSRSNSYYSHHQPTVELGAFPAENLAKRLGLTVTALESEHSKLTAKEFISYTRNRDP